jgi:hypothetical protein
MRIFVVILVVALAIDAFVFGGRYSDAAWQAVREQTNSFNYELRSFLAKHGM